MNVGHTSNPLNALRAPSPSVSAAKSGAQATSESTIPASGISSDSAPGQPSSSVTNSSISRINDPLNPDQVRQSDNRGLSPGIATQSATQSATAPSSRLSSAEFIESDQQVQAQVRQLAQRDREVRNHEAAHAAAGGGLTGAPSYSYTRGPDGQLYATAGEVGINTSRSANPETSIQNARTVLQAALAPANPSPQDLRVAAQARAQLIDAQAELNRNEQQASEQTSPAVEAAQGQAAEQQLAGSESAEKELEEKELEEKESQREAADDRLPQSRDELQQRQARSQQMQLEFAQEMVDLNLRIQQVQQQLIETGQADPATLLQGSLVDTQA
ncbi:MAG: putative metalloprotease CJM1_0395 family protein [Motiliproteus sp.]